MIIPKKNLSCLLKLLANWQARDKKAPVNTFEAMTCSRCLQSGIMNVWGIRNADPLVIKLECRQCFFPFEFRIPIHRGRLRAATQPALSLTGIGRTISQRKKDHRRSLQARYAPFWAALRPIRYQLDGSYPLEEVLKQGCNTYLVHEINPLDEHARRVKTVLTYLKENRFPTFWVARELLEDLQAARLPANADLDRIRWPIPAGVFLFRPRAGRGPRVGVPFLSFAMTNPLEERDPFFPPTARHLVVSL